MKKSFQRVIATLNLFQGKQSLAIFLLAAIFALSACDDSSSAGDDDNNVILSSDSREESSDSRSNDKDEAISSNGKVESNRSSSSAKETKDSSDTKSSSSVKSGNSSNSHKGDSSSSVGSSSSEKQSSSAMSKVESSSSEEMKNAWDYLNPDVDYGEFIDERDGQVYKTVVICDREYGENCRIWMAQNLNYAYTGVPYKYNADNRIYVSDSTSWCYENDSFNCDKYGRLYTWSAAMDSAAQFSENAGTECGYMRSCTPNNLHRGVCPDGWHVPTDAEYDTLFFYTGGFLSASWNLKSASSWYSGFSANQYGFSVLPAGIRDYNGNFVDERYRTYFWTASEGNMDDYAWGKCFYYKDSEVSKVGKQKKVGLSLRCVKDSN
jgi:uncharacterized protein (TIGR02145 family)